MRSVTTISIPTTIWENLGDPKNVSASTAVYTTPSPTRGTGRPRTRRCHGSGGAATARNRAERIHSARLQALRVPRSASGPVSTVRRQTRGVTVAKPLNARQKSLIEE